MDAADQANEQMVDRLITEGALWTPSLIAAFRATPRHRFLDRVFQYQRKQNRWKEVLTREPGPEELRILYSDRALITRLGGDGSNGFGVPISSSSQPSLMAQMLEDLRLGPRQRVLEIGAGTGYNAALMGHVVGPSRVTTVDVDRAVLSEAWDHLRAYPERQINLRHADGRHGFAEAAPYDRIMVTAATPDLEPAWLEQTKEGGLVLAPLVLAPGLAYVVRGSVTGGVFEGRLTRAAYFMPLRAEGETGSGDFLAPTGPTGRSLPAPWAGWFDRRRPRFQWLALIQALGFYAWVRGLEVQYRAQPNGQPVFGISRPDQGSIRDRDTCWLGIQDWEVDGDGGRDLGWALWRAFLDAGGPWPTEFQLRAAYQRDLPLHHRPEEYMRQGPRCRQVWELIQPRERSSWI